MGEVASSAARRLRDLQFGAAHLSSGAPNDNCHRGHDASAPGVRHGDLTQVLLRCARVRDRQTDSNTIVPNRNWAWLRLNGVDLMLNTAYEYDKRPPAADPCREAIFPS
jgi:hypothetical protein